MSTSKIDIFRFHLERCYKIGRSVETSNVSKQNSTEANRLIRTMLYIASVTTYIIDVTGVV